MPRAGAPPPLRLFAAFSRIDGRAVIPLLTSAVRGRVDWEAWDICAHRSTVFSLENDRVPCGHSSPASFNRCRANRPTSTEPASPRRRISSPHVIVEWLPGFPPAFSGRASCSQVAGAMSGCRIRGVYMRKVLAGLLVTLAVGASGCKAKPEPAAPAATPQAAMVDRTVLPIRAPDVSADHRTGRAQGDAAAPLRGEGPRGRPERADRADRRHGLRHVERVRRADPHADGRAPGQRRPALQPVPHDGPLLADANGAAQRPQPPHEQHGRDHGDGDRLPGQHGAAPGQRGAARRDAAPERLQHRLLRQEPRDGGLGGESLRPDHPLAEPLRLRRVLRVHGRRDQPVGAARLSRHEPRGDSRTTRTTTS